MPTTELKSPDSLALKTTLETIQSPEVSVTKKLFLAEEPADDNVAPSQESKETQNVTHSSVEHRERLVAFYEKYNPSKLDTVDATLLKYQGKEEEMFRKLEQKYNSGAFPPPSGSGPKCFLNFQDHGRVEVQLFSDKTPLACENFRALCTGELNKGFSGSLVHRIVPNFCIQGGDFTNGDGTGGESIYPPNSEHGDMWGKFKDEFFMQHNQKGLVSMANNGKDRNGSQFFVTLAPLPHLDGKHVVFGKVTVGMNVVEAISKTLTDKKQRPLEQVVISGCGEVRSGEDFFVEPSKISQATFHLAQRPTH
jgi:cyclophilin family peptidyl-prolyl cis-trans isomerase